MRLLPAALVRGGEGSGGTPDGGTEASAGAAPGAPAGGGSGAAERHARLPWLLQADPVSRHTRLILWGLAALLVLLEVGLFVAEPAMQEWMMSDPALRAELEAQQAAGDPDAAAMEPRSGLGLVIRVALLLFGVLCTLLYAWQPSLAAVVVLSGAAACLLGLVGPDHEQITPLSFAPGVLLGAAMTARYSRGAFVWTGFAALVAITVAAEILTEPDVGDFVGQQGMHAATAVAALFAAAPALVIRRSRHQAQDRLAAMEAAERRAREAAEAERQRIAAELHDVVAHGLTVVSMQAAMLPTLTDPQRRRSAEEAIETAARQSLVDLRRMLTALRGTSRNEDTRGEEDVADLRGRLEQFRGSLVAAGYRVTGRVEGLEDLPESLKLTVLRLAQEATTNVLKHGPRTGDVELCTSLDGQGRLRLHVDSPLAVQAADRARRGPGEDAPRRGPGTGPGDGVVALGGFPSSGFGLAGMAERVSLFGGSITAGAADGRWVVDAVLPTR